MYRFLIAWIALLMLAACATAGPQTVVLRQTVDDLTVVLEKPTELVALRDYELVVSLADAQGQPLDGASVYLDLTMPGMTMGVNQPFAEPLGNGRYRVRTAYSMEGNWRTTVHVSVNDKEHVANFDHPVDVAGQ
jgi:nitrogen fixation protein FixH